MLPEPLLDLFARQWGLAARFQIRQTVADPAVRRRIYHHADLEHPSPRVLRHRAARPSNEQRVLLGVLDAGADGLLWGKSAVTLWGVDRFRLLPAHVAVPRRTVDGDRLAQIHVVRHLEPCDRVVHADVPIARPEVSLLWLAGMWTHRLGHDLATIKTEIAVDQAWRQRLIDGTFIHALAARSAGRGRSGIVVMRAVLEDRPPDYRPAGSRLEERFEELIGDRCAGRLDRQVTVDVERAIRTVDFRVRNMPKVIEINGEAWHTSLTDRAEDAERYERLIALGFSVLVLWEYDIWHDQEAVRRAVDRYLRHPDPAPMLHRPTKAPWEW